jgi:hypothetical protein
VGQKGEPIRDQDVEVERKCQRHHAVP